MTSRQYNWGMRYTICLTMILMSMTGRAGGGLELVDSFDIERYLGLWYEIARLPNRFQSRCARDVTARYQLMDSGQVLVTNRCRSDDGQWIEAQGRARADSSDGRPAALEVRFAPRWLAWLPLVWGEYRVIALDEDYQRAVVGSDDREFLWILARHPRLAEAELEQLIEQAARQGFEIGRLERTRQSDSGRRAGGQ